MAKSAKSGDTVRFIPAVTFFGYPDDKTRVDYVAGVAASTTPSYLALLREKGLVADDAAIDMVAAETADEAVAPI